MRGFWVTRRNKAKYGCKYHIPLDFSTLKEKKGGSSMHETTSRLNPSFCVVCFLTYVSEISATCRLRLSSLASRNLTIKSFKSCKASGRFAIHIIQDASMSLSFWTGFTTMAQTDDTFVLFWSYSVRRYLQLLSDVKTIALKAILLVESLDNFFTL